LRSQEFTVIGIEQVFSTPEKVDAFGLTSEIFGVRCRF
jgi:hypothetical protein